MLRDLTVYKTPALDLSLDELVERLQKKFGSQGMLNGLIRSTVAREVEAELNVNREVFREILLQNQNWETFFPGVREEDVDLEAELDEFIAEKRPELTAILHDYVMKRAVVVGTPSLNLLRSAEVVQRTSEFPCNGKPHDFLGNTTFLSSFVVTKKGKTHFNQSYLWWLNIMCNIRHSPWCGKQRRKVIVKGAVCANCKTIKVADAYFEAYCESCSAQTRAHRIKKTSTFVRQILLQNGLMLYHS